MAASATAHMGREAQPQGPWDEGWEAEVHQDLGTSPRFLGGSLGCAESPCASLLPDACPHGLAGHQGSRGTHCPSTKPSSPRSLAQGPGNSGYCWWGYSRLLRLQAARAGPASSLPCQSSWVQSPTRRLVEPCIHHD